jgi:hypothetical protein
MVAQRSASADRQLCSALFVERWVAPYARYGPGHRAGPTNQQPHVPHRDLESRLPKGLDHAAGRPAPDVGARVWIEVDERRRPKERPPGAYDDDLAAMLFDTSDSCHYSEKAAGVNRRDTGTDFERGGAIAEDADVGITDPSTEPWREGDLVAVGHRLNIGMTPDQLA